VYRVGKPVLQCAVLAAGSFHL